MKSRRRQKVSSISSSDCLRDLLLSSSSFDMDISVIFRLAAIGIIVTVVCQILKKSDRDDISTVVSIVGLVIALTIAVTMIGDLFDMVQDIFGVT